MGKSHGNGNAVTGRNKVWDLVKLPEGKRAIGSKWV